MASLSHSQKRILSKLLGLAVQSRFRHKLHKNLVKIECPGKPKPLFEPDSKVALITGGSEGIGLAVAQEFLAENARSVVLAGICNDKGRKSVIALNNTYGKNKAIFINCDVQSKVQVTDCFGKLMKEYGTLDILVNAAGVFDERNWEKEVMTNFVGSIYNMLEAYKIMCKQHNKGKGGFILNFAGLSGVCPLGPAPILSASDHGIVGLTRSFGDEATFKTSGVRVVALCLGCTKTNFIKDAEKRALNESMGNQLRVELQKAKRQKADVCAKSALHVMRYGASGSVWVVDGSKLYSLRIPNWKQYRVLESQLI